MSSEEERRIARRNVDAALTTIVDAIGMDVGERRTVCHHMLLDLVAFNDLDLWDGHMDDVYKLADKLIGQSVDSLHAAIRRMRQEELAPEADG